MHPRLFSKTLAILATSIWLIGCGYHGPTFTPEEQARFHDGTRRHAEAHQLLLQHDDARATDAYLALWIETTLPSRPRGTYFCGNLKTDILSLVKSYPPARERFEALRQPSESFVLAGAANRWEENEWLEFTQMIGAEDALVMYVEQFSGDRHRMERLSYGPRQTFDRLIAQDRWDLAAWVYSDPAREAGVFSGSYSSGRGPLTQALNTLVSVPLLPLVLYGRGMTSSGGPPSDEFLEQERKCFQKHMEQRLIRGARIAAACMVAGRVGEAKQILRQAITDVGDERAREVFAAAAKAASESEKNRSRSVTPAAKPASPASA